LMRLAGGRGRDSLLSSFILASEDRDRVAFVVSIKYTGGGSHGSVAWPNADGYTKCRNVVHLSTSLSS
jgi:hypothetical protein